MRAEQTGLQGNLARFNTSSSLGSSTFFFFQTDKLISLPGQDAVLAGSSISAARILSGNTEVVL